MDGDKIIFTSHPRRTAELTTPVRIPGYQGEPVERRHRMLALLDDPWNNRNLCWDALPITGSYCLDPEMRSKQVKVGFEPEPDHVFHPIRCFPISLWVDPGVEFREDLDLGALETYHLQSSDLCAFRHPTHDCAYDYAEDLRARFPGRADVISAQVDKYLRDGFPRKRGLVDTSVLMRRHAARVRKICATWWREILLGDRDEVLSLTYAMWKHGASVAEFLGLLGEDFAPGAASPPGASSPRNSYFRRRPR